MENETISGHLLKRTTGKVRSLLCLNLRFRSNNNREQVKRWKKRYFELRGDHLRWFSSDKPAESSGDFKGDVDLNNLQYIRVLQDTHTLVLRTFPGVWPGELTVRHEWHCIPASRSRRFTISLQLKMDGNANARRWEKAIRLRRQQSAEESIKATSVSQSMGTTLEYTPAAATDSEKAQGRCVKKQRRGVKKYFHFSVLYVTAMNHAEAMLSLSSCSGRAHKRVWGSRLGLTLTVGVTTMGL